jgi:hypothetical protein
VLESRGEAAFPPRRLEAWSGAGRLGGALQASLPWNVSNPLLLARFCSFLFFSLLPCQSSANPHLPAARSASVSRGTWTSVPRCVCWSFLSSCWSGWWCDTWEVRARANRRVAPPIPPPALWRDLDGTRGRYGNKWDAGGAYAPTAPEMRDWCIGVGVHWRWRSAE